MTDRKCEVCRQEIPRVRSAKKYCSSVCLRVAAAMRRKSDGLCLVHSCVSGEFDPIPIACPCKFVISYSDAVKLLHSGSVISRATRTAEWRVGEDLVAKMTINGRTPRTPTIEAEHIFEAYVYGNEEAAERIEEYGRSTLWARIKTGKAYTIRAFRPDPFDGRVVLINFDW